MKKPFFGVYNPSIILTYISVFAALAGISILLTADNGTLTCMKTVIILLIVSGICDMFDGSVARKCKRTDVEKEFGVQLDSLADTVAFVVYPATILLHLAGGNSITYVIACFYVFAGIMRLGWFNVTTEENKGLFQGLPVTTAAGLIPLVYTIANLAHSTNHIGSIMQTTCGIIALLFISNFKLKKPNGKMKAIMGVIALTIAAFIIFTL